MVRRIIRTALMLCMFIFYVSWPSLMPMISSTLKSNISEVYLIDAQVTSEGHMKVKEFISLKGEYNGMEFIKQYGSNSFAKFNGSLDIFDGSNSLYNATRIGDIKSC